MFFQKSFKKFISVVTIIFVLCAPILWAKDEDKPPEDGPLPTYAGSVQVFIF